MSIDVFLSDAPIDVHMAVEVVDVAFDDQPINVELGFDGPVGPAATDASKIALPTEVSALLGGAGNLLDALIWLSQQTGNPPVLRPFWLARRGLLGAI